jgi:hypothetical protein
VYIEAFVPSSKSISFAPPESQINAILLALIDPARSFDAVAQAHNTTADALSLWLIRPDVAERFRLHESAVISRLHLIAAHTLTTALQAVSRILTEFNNRPACPPSAPHSALGSQASASPSPPESSLSDQLASAQAATTACRAAALLLRFARFTAAPITPRTPAPSTPRASASATHAPASSATPHQHNKQNTTPQPPAAPAISINTPTLTINPQIPRPLPPNILDNALNDFKSPRSQTAHLLAKAGGLPAG